MDIKGTLKKGLAVLCIMIAAVTFHTIAFADEYRLIEEVCGSNTIKYYYDSVGKLTETRSFSGNTLYQTSKYYYGADDKLTEIIKTAPDGWVTLYFHFDSNGTRIELENPGMGGDVATMAPEEAIVEEELDAEGRIVRFTKKFKDMSDGSPAITEHKYIYDTFGRIVRFQGSDITDVFNYRSDGSFNRVRSIKHDNSSTIREEYNSKGLLKKSVDQYGNISEYSYDASGNVVKRITTFPSTFPAGNIPETKSISVYEYKYDMYGKVILMTETVDDSPSLISEYRYEKTTSQNYATESDMIYCPRCGKQIPTESRFCMYCRYEIPSINRH